MHVSGGQLRGFFRHNPFHQQPLKVFAKSKPKYDAIIFATNSPVKAVFDLGLRKLRESGTVSQLQVKWEGQKIISQSDVDKMILSPGQVILIYFIMGGAFALALVVFVMELIATKINGGRPMRFNQSRPGTTAAADKADPRSVLAMTPSKSQQRTAVSNRRWSRKEALRSHSNLIVGINKFNMKL